MKFYQQALIPLSRMVQLNEHIVLFLKELDLLIGADLDIKFWPYTFLHVLHIHNSLPGAGETESLIFQLTGKKDNFNFFCVFGCRVWIRPPGIWCCRFKDDAQKDIFLGYIPHTGQLILWYDCETEQVKITTQKGLMIYWLNLYL